MRIYEKQENNNWKSSYSSLDVERRAPKKLYQEKTMLNVKNNKQLFVWWTKKIYQPGFQKETDGILQVS